MSEEVDPFTLLTPEQRRARLQEIAAEELRPKQAIPDRRQPLAKAPRTLEERVLLIGAVVVGAVVVLGLAVRLSTPHTDASQSPMPVRVASSTPTPAPPPAASAPSTDPDVRSDGGLDYLGLKAEAEEKLDGVLSDDHGVRYRDVHTKLSTMNGGGIVAFCGEENSRTPEGGYGGFQRFIASRSVAVTEDRMPPADFEQAWSSFCENGVEGPQVWF